MLRFSSVGVGAITICHLSNDLASAKLASNPFGDDASLFACYDTLLQLFHTHAPLVEVTVRSRQTVTWYVESCRDAKMNTPRFERFYRTNNTAARHQVLCKFRQE